LDAGAITSSLSFAEQQKLEAVLLTHHHYDHIRDVPLLAMNLYLSEAAITIYSIPPVYDALNILLAEGRLYPNFLERPEDKPTITFKAIEPLRIEPIEGYEILAVPVNHSSSAVGYQITSPTGEVLFYTGDAGPGLSEHWQRLSPQMIITEVTVPNGYEDYARESGHLTPELLRQELVEFGEVRGYQPQVVTVHMNPGLEREIEAEIAAVAGALDSSITLGYEGMYLRL